MQWRVPRQQIAFGLFAPFILNFAHQLHIKLSLFLEDKREGEAADYDIPSTLALNQLI